MASPKRPATKGEPQANIALAIHIKGTPSDEDKVIVARAMQDAFRAIGLGSISVTRHQIRGKAQFSLPAAVSLPGATVVAAVVGAAP